MSKPKANPDMPFSREQLKLFFIFILGQLSVVLADCGYEVLMHVIIWFFMAWLFMKCPWVKYMIARLNGKDREQSDG